MIFTETGIIFELIELICIVAQIPLWFGVWKLLDKIKKRIK